MKKIFTLLAIAIALVAVSCEKTPIESTATVDLAGQWYVTYQAVDDAGNVIDDDFNGGYSLALTFNTSANDTDHILISDEGNHLGWKAKVPCNLSALTFGSSEMLPNIEGETDYHGAGIIINNGKIVKGGAETPSGMPADSIYFEVTLEDDYYIGYYSYYEYGDYTHYIVSGYRYTGFAADE